MVATKVFPHDHDVDALGFMEGGSHRLLMVNKRDRSIAVQVPKEFVGGKVHAVAEGKQPEVLGSEEYVLPPFGVTILEGAGR
jgi:hypothetical protein